MVGGEGLGHLGPVLFVSIEDIKKLSEAFTFSEMFRFPNVQISEIFRNILTFKNFFFQICDTYFTMNQLP